MVTTTSVTPCTDAENQVGQFAVVLLFDAAEVDDENPAPVVEQVARTSEYGRWTTTVTVPKTAKNGDTYVAIAACFAGADSNEPFRVYESEEFVVAVAPTAPPASPVAGKPAFTG